MFSVDLVDIIKCGDERKRGIHETRILKIFMPLA
jgi:hypothetical protein